MADDDGRDEAGPGWAEAVAELEQLLVDLEDDDVDVDVLGRKVRRAAELIAACRGRIDAARFEVARVVTELEADALDEDVDGDEAAGAEDGDGTGDGDG